MLPFLSCCMEHQRGREGERERAPPLSLRPSLPGRRPGGTVTSAVMRYPVFRALCGATPGTGSTPHTVSTVGLCTCPAQGSPNMHACTLAGAGQACVRPQKVAPKCKPARFEGWGQACRAKGDGPGAGVGVAGGGQGGGRGQGQGARAGGRAAGTCALVRARQGGGVRGGGAPCLRACGRGQAQRRGQGCWGARACACVHV
jgi:hypothetical protein